MKIAPQDIYMSNENDEKVDTKYVSAAEVCDAAKMNEYTEMKLKEFTIG